MNISKLNQVLAFLAKDGGFEGLGPVGKLTIPPIAPPPVIEVCMAENPFPFTSKAIKEDWWHPDTSHVTVYGIGKEAVAILECPNCHTKFHLGKGSTAQYLQNPDPVLWRTLLTTPYEEP